MKFCGNCNPYIDTVSLLEKIKNTCQNVEFIHWDEGGFSILLILNSCHVGCATHPDFSGPKIIVDSNSINYIKTLPENLYNDIIKILNELKDLLV